MPDRGSGNSHKCPPSSSNDRERHRLGNVLQALVESLDPFPAFYGMTTLQAIEVELEKGVEISGCIVLLPDSQFYELSLRTIPGLPDFFFGEDQVEELERLELSDQAYIQLAHAAIKNLSSIAKEQGNSSRRK